ncbi:MAG: hypothetical protein ACKOET_09375 [Verrucomicrobiota bacterium]
MKPSRLSAFLLALQAALAVLLVLLSGYYWQTTRTANRQAALLNEFTQNNRALQALIAETVAYGATNRAIDPFLLGLGIQPNRSPAAPTPAANRR